MKNYWLYADLKWCFCFVSGAPSIRKFHVLRDRRHVITKDSEDKVTVWDVLKVRIVPFSSELCIFCFVLIPKQYHLQVANVQYISGVSQVTVYIPVILVNSACFRHVR